jgi:pimeloyl-ACP methyl ester carboxylesterase
MKTAAMILLALIVTAAICVGAWAYAPDASALALEMRYLRSSTYLEVEGIRLRVADSGPRDAPVVILLHGFGSSLETWDSWAEDLSRDHRVIRFDLPGFGLTGPDPTGDYSDARAVSVLVALMDRLGTRRAALVGNSLGGRIAWRFAAAQPERTTALVLISPDGFASPGFAYGKKPEPSLMLKLIPYVLPRSLLRMNLAAAYGDPQRLSDATVERYRDLMLAPGVRGAILARMEQVVLRDPVPILRTIKAPTLLLWGERDGMIPFSNAADYAKNIPHLTLVSFPKLGHVPFEEAPAASLPPVRAFLAANVPARD